MKILITENQLKKIISEINDVDKAKLIEMGAEIVEECVIGPYNLMLVTYEDGEYEVGITTEDEPFATPESQRHKAMGDNIKNPKKLWFMIKNKLNDWLNAYGKLIIGSYNRKRVAKYHRLCNMMNMDTSNISSADEYDFFMLYP